MKIKIMYPNPHGRLEFSKEELEQILKEAYDEGVADGMNSRNYSSSISIASPYIYTSPTVDVCLNNDTLTTTANDLSSTYGLDSARASI
jgi:hypothetical protein